MERDKRKNNAVIMGLNENLSDTETKDFLEGMFCKIMDNERSKFEVKGRIGKTGDKCRPLRIEFEEPVYKRGILKKANTLKQESKYERIYICPDLTRKQQEEDKTLRDKVKEFRNQGMVGVKINRGCVVKMEGSKGKYSLGRLPLRHNDFIQEK